MFCIEVELYMLMEKFVKFKILCYFLKNVFLFVKNEYEKRFFKMKLIWMNYFLNDLFCFF